MATKGKVPKKAAGKKPAASKPKAAAADAKTTAKEVAVIVKKAEGWKGKKLAELRAIINKADSALTEEVKWKMPSKPDGVIVWTHNGIVCHVDILKTAVRINFHKGKQLKDPKKLFNARLDSSAVRAIDFGEEDSINKAALTALIAGAVRLNPAKTK